MGLTKFPKGVSSFGVPLLGGAIPFTTGTYFFVDSNTGVAGNSGLEPTKALATIVQAIAKCTASKGDVVVVMPGHAETVAAASGLALSTAGVRVIGLGTGNLRPTITLTATAATIAMSAANCSLENVIIAAGIDDVVKCIVVSAAGCTLTAVDFVETSAMQALCFLLTTAAANQLTIQNCRHNQVAAGALKWIDLVGADDLIIRDNDINVTCATHVIGGTTTESLNVNIYRNNICNGGVDAASIIMLASSTGMVTYNNVAGGKSAIAGTIALANCYGAQNFACNTVNKNGLLDPVVDS